MVVAPAGCGKTHILVARAVYAHSLGIGYEDMMYVTPTSRAARCLAARMRESTAVVVGINYEADAIFEAMDALGVDHYDLSGMARKNFYRSLSAPLSLTTLASVGGPPVAPHTSHAHCDGSEPIVVATIHRVRGMEFDNVIVANVQVFDVLPRARMSGSSSMDEARRLLYVALSCARRRLVLALVKGHRKILT